MTVPGFFLRDNRAGFISSGSRQVRMSKERTRHRIPAPYSSSYLGYLRGPMSGDSTPRSQGFVRSSVGRARTLWGTRIAPALMAPLGILLTIPILVGGAGLAIWWQGRVAVDESVDAIAARQFRDRAEEGARHARDLLAQAGPLTDNMVAYVRRKGLDPPLQDFALRFRDLLHASPGVGYISFGTHEGHYFGVYLDAERRFVLTHGIYHGPQRTHTREYYIGDDGSLTLFKDNPEHGFDPRVRPWYSATVRNGRRTWSEPYVWFDQGVVGITCSDPILDGNGGVLAVTTCDFHLNALSEFVEGLKTQEGGRTFVFTDQHDVIAFPGARQEFGQGHGKGTKLKVADLEDPVVAQLFAAMPPLGGEAAGQFPFEANGEPYLAAVRPIRVGEDGHWYVATFGPTGPLTAPAERHQRNALIVSAAALVFTTLVAAFFARFLVRTHLLIERAESRADEADARARRLGSYRLTRKIGEGGMGEVWVAEHAMLARPAAIKLIRPNFLDEKNPIERRNVIERFRREAETIAGLRSRHTIRIYDFGVADDGALFYVMELLDGIDLDALVRKHGPVPARGAVEILRQAAASLREAHTRGVVHRDIKPANLFLCREGDEVDVVKVLDFGMARHVDKADPSLTTDTLSGTPAFMSPEQIHERKDLDGRSDVYALGCVAYWLFAGRAVFPRDTVLAMVMAHVNEEPEPLGKVAETPVPPALEELVARCLAKDRDERPADMAALAAELGTILADLPEDGWDPAAREAWWAAMPSRFDERGPEAEESVRLSPERTG
jgi:tRNA A-37 threonylcarbamoyl transferase component Bud32